MSIIAWLVLGLISGFIASKLVNRTGEGVLLDIVLGIVVPSWEAGLEHLWPRWCHGAEPLQHAGRCSGRGRRFGALPRDIRSPRLIHASGAGLNNSRPIAVRSPGCDGSRNIRDRKAAAVQRIEGRVDT